MGTPSRPRPSAQPSKPRIEQGKGRESHRCRKPWQAASFAVPSSSSSLSQEVPTPQSSPDTHGHPSTGLMSFPLSPHLARCYAKHFCTFSFLPGDPIRCRGAGGGQSCQGRMGTPRFSPRSLQAQDSSHVYTMLLSVSPIFPPSPITGNNVYRDPWWTFPVEEANSSLRNSGQTLHSSGGQRRGDGVGEAGKTPQQLKQACTSLIGGASPAFNYCLLILYSQV